MVGVPGVTLKPFVIEATSDPVVIVTERPPTVAEGMMKMFAVACVLSVTEVEFTMIPGPKSAILVP
jgi:hypothetical protein